MTQATPPGPDNRIGAARIVAGFVILLMLVLAANIGANDSFGHGSGMDTFNAGSSNPWQLFINMDLMSGLLLILGWMIWRERGESVLRIVAWAVLFLWWGNIAVASFILTSLYLSGGRADMLLMGRRIGQPLPAGATGKWAAMLCLIGALASAIVMVRGLIAVQFVGMGAFGYAVAFGTLIFALLVFAFVPPRRA